MPRRVGLLTLPLSDNFGGMLQIIALYNVIAQQGHEVFLIDKKNLRTPVKRFIATIFENLPLQNYNGIRGRYLAKIRHSEQIKKLIPNRTRTVSSGREIEHEVNRLGIDTIIVGSDQVWRFEYQGDGSELNYFLDFGGEGVRKISYAASFGHANWIYPNRTSEVERCLREFEGISVRENSGLEIIKESFGGINATLALDPTCLLPKKFYQRISESVPVQGGMLCYTIDRSERVEKVLYRIESTLNSSAKTSRMSPHDASTSIPMWLKKFEDAEFILTDSFHGVIFSIIFERNFLVIPNLDRGLDRFITILTLLGLEDRIVKSDSDADIEEKIRTPIDYLAVHALLAAAKDHSLDFLRRHME